jgi:hypothetical protein
MLQGYSLSSVSIRRSKKSLCIVYNDLGSKLVVYIAAILLRFFLGLIAYCVGHGNVTKAVRNMKICRK